MHAIVVATSDEELRARIVQQLASESRTAAYCASWPEALSKLAKEQTRLLLIDGELAGASGEILELVRRSLPHQPLIRALRTPLPPIELIRNWHHLSSYTLTAERSVLSDRDKKLIPLIGIGPEPQILLHNLVHSPLPLRFEGERGIGKEWLARLVHRMNDEERPFLILRPGEEPQVRESISGTLYIADLDSHRFETILSTLSLAAATKWRVMAGARHPPDRKREGVGWTHVPMRPLRDRLKDLRPLARLYLDDYRKRLGLPARRITTELWSHLERYSWPGNHRELETFMVQAATSARGTTLSPDTLPRWVINLLDMTERERGDRHAFEELVETSLRPVVARYEPSPDATTLYALVIEATERALLRLALRQTTGNQKAAAELLGISRNTLRERLARLNPMNEEG